MTILARDLVYAIRMLLRSPAFATIAVLALTLGIGGSTVLFSVVNGVLLNPLAYPSSGELMGDFGNQARRSAQSDRVAEFSRLAARDANLRIAGHLS